MLFKVRVCMHILVLHWYCVQAMHAFYVTHRNLLITIALLSSDIHESNLIYIRYLHVHRHTLVHTLSYPISGVWCITYSSECIRYKPHCMSDGSLGSLHRWRSQRIAKCWSCELQDTLAQLFLGCGTPYSLNVYIASQINLSCFITRQRLQRARLRVLFLHHTFYTYHKLRYGCV